MRVAVLGGAGGIGRALVAALAARGDEAVVLDLAVSLERHGIARIALDVTDDAAVARAAGELAERFGSIDGFVNLAGYNVPLQPLAAMATADFDDVIGGNLRGMFLATKAMLPLVADGGAAVLMASGLAQNVRPGYGAYAASKAGVVALTKTFAHESAPRVRVNAVAPGLVDTAFIRGGTGRSDESAAVQQDFGPYIAAIPLRRIAVPQDVVGPTLFLLDGAASGYMTGQVLWVNGGGYMP